MNTFRNEPLLELRRGAVRTECLTALAALDAKLPLEVPMLIGEDVVHGQVFSSVDPSNPTTIVANAHAATAQHTADAISASGRKASFHGSCMTTCDQAHSAQKPTVPISAPAAARMRRSATP